MFRNLALGQTLKRKPQDCSNPFRLLVHNIKIPGFPFSFLQTNGMMAKDKIYCNSPSSSTIVVVPIEGLISTLSGGVSSGQDCTLTVKFSGFST